MDDIDRLMQGTIDMHVHAGPSLFPRSVDQVEAAQQADAAGMRAIVVKDHHHSSAPDLMLLQKHVFQGLKTQVFGSVCLNSYTGGLNPYIVDMTIRMGGRVIWFPTISAANHIHHHEKQFPTQEQRALAETPVQVFDEHGDLLPAARQILRLIADADVIVSPGHASAAEAIVIIRGAAEAGVRRMVVNHPQFLLEATEEQVCECVRLGAYIEHSICMYPGMFPIDHLIRWIKLVGPEKTLLGSDLGQRNMPLPVDGLRTTIKNLLAEGIKEADIEQMTKTNPAWLLKLES